ncbi:flavin reductase family protein [Streptomyces sp. NPDC026672]|uniref:flavin reductase family protein n=1 Tax=unclassified Streptomyces TaxID=2593676 RepID=UPI0033DE6361
MSAAPPLGAAERERLRGALGRFATGVTVLTAGRETPRGMTAGSFTSVSLDPPLVLVCVARTAAVHATVLAEGGFAVSVLGARQARLARHFADHRRPRDGHEFDVADTFPGRFTGAPLLHGALAWLECALTAVHDGGDHSILLGAVREASRGTADEPLLHFGGALRP